MAERQRCSTCFGTNAVTTHLVAGAHLKWLKETEPEAVRSAAFLYTRVGAATTNAKAMAAGWEKAGWNVEYTAGIDTTEFNYAPYVQELKNRGIRAVGFLGPFDSTVKLQQAMRRQGYEPDIFIQDGTIYDERYTKQAGDVAEGMMVYLNHPLFTSRAPEMQLYMAWLQQVKPGAIPNYFGLYAWSAARLFVERATALGGGLNRKSLVAEFGKVSKWTANGLHAEQNVSGGRTANCAIVARYEGGEWKKISPGEYLCAPLIDVR
jgi:ABC-type branched-subunit amino acid transport system substrate-binding protein